jgi:hypothetical protein
MLERGEHERQQAAHHGHLQRIHDRRDEYWQQIDCLDPALSAPSCLRQALARPQVYLTIKLCHKLASSTLFIIEEAYHME